MKSCNSLVYCREAAPPPIVGRCPVNPLPLTRRGGLGRGAAGLGSLGTIAPRGVRRLSPPSRAAPLQALRLLRLALQEAGGIEKGREGRLAGSGSEGPEEPPPPGP